MFSFHNLLQIVWVRLLRASACREPKTAHTSEPARRLQAATCLRLLPGLGTLGTPRLTLRGATPSAATVPWCNRRPTTWGRTRCTMVTAGVWTGKILRRSQEWCCWVTTALGRAAWLASLLGFQRRKNNPEVWYSIWWSLNTPNNSWLILLVDRQLYCPYCYGYTLLTLSTDLRCILVKFVQFLEFLLP